MTTNPIRPCACAALLALSACIVPPALFERASWSSPDDWQERGRYRQAPGSAEGSGETQPDAAPAAPRTAITCTDPLREDAAPPQAAAPEPPLYAWDGGVVDGAPQGRVAPETGAPRGPETPPAGRTHIIELYQQVLDERDALAEEVERLRKQLDETTRALETETQEATGLAARVAALEAGNRDLTSENQAIAARLVQAQIRRLEAEKLLLETRIEIERARAEEAALAAARAKPGAARSKAPKTTGEAAEVGDR